MRENTARLMALTATVVGFSLLAAACGGSFDREETVTTVQETFALDRVQADCVVDGLVDEFGEDALSSTDDPTDEQVAALIEHLDACQQGTDPVVNALAEEQAPIPVTNVPELDALASRCADGDGAACDDLYWQAPIDSAIEEWALTCGGTTYRSYPCASNAEG